MATNTTRLSLRKPADSDLISVLTDISENMDKIDAADAAVVHTTTDEAVAGVKTFASAPVVPVDSWPLNRVAGLITALANRVQALFANPLVQGGSDVRVLDGSGASVIIFPTAFSAITSVVICNGDAGATLAYFNVGGISTAQFTFDGQDFTGASMAGATVRVNWIAFGTV